eukprot:1149220-Pelagomonas_calceolata.AAC.1
MGEEVDEGTGGSADEAVGDNVAVAAEATKKLVLAHAGGDLQAGEAEGDKGSAASAEEAPVLAHAGMDLRAGGSRGGVLGPVCCSEGITHTCLAQSLFPCTRIAPCRHLGYPCSPHK